MVHQDIVILTKQGEPTAIAFVLNQALRSQDITAKVVRKDNQLHILLEADRVLHQQACFELVQKSLLSANVASIESFRVYGRKIGQEKPDWHQAFKLEKHSSSELFSESGAGRTGGHHPYGETALERPTESSIESPSTGNKTKILLVAIASISLVLGTTWEFLTTFKFYSPTVFISTLSNYFGSVKLSVATLSPHPEPATHPLSQSPNNKLSHPILKRSKLSNSSISPESVTIKAVGDIIPGTNFPNNRLAEKEQILFQSVKPYLEGADILFGNFESTLTNYRSSAKDISKGMVFAFRTPPTYAKLLKQTGFNVLSVANNHSMDFFKTGFEDTLKNIEGAGMKAVGKKGEILYIKIRNVPVAFIAFSNYDYHNSTNNLAAAKALVQEAKKKASIVIISVHAGAEGTGAMHVRNKVEMFYGENRGNLVLFAHTMVDSGADLILGHGPHVPRALELYKGKAIAYSLGNFLGYRTLSTVGELGYSLILEVKMNSQGDFISGKIIPVHLDRRGIPYIDRDFRSVKLIRYLTKSDFPKTQITIDNEGKILKH